MTGDLNGETDTFKPRPEGLRGTAGEGGGRTGEPGRLTKVSIVGGMGVLDGRGPGSIGKTGKGLGNAIGGASSRLSTRVCFPD